MCDLSGLDRRRLKVTALILVSLSGLLCCSHSLKECVQLNSLTLQQTTCFVPYGNHSLKQLHFLKLPVISSNTLKIKLVLSSVRRCALVIGTNTVHCVFLLIWSIKFHLCLWLYFLLDGGLLVMWLLHGLAC